MVSLSIDEAIFKIVTYLPDERLDAAGTAVYLIEGDLADDLVAIVPRMSVNGVWRGGRDCWRHTFGAS